MNSSFLSVVMITYKHEKFIAQAIEGVLKQETNFGVQLIIGDDFSPDETQKICLEYEAKYPDKITVLKRDKNIGVQPNFVDCFNHSAGSKYVAVCEGDDYWTDPKKLQKQVDFLEKNEDFALSFHNTKVTFFSGEETPYLLNEGIEKDVFGLDDIIGEDEIWFMATTSTVYRRSAIGTFPAWFNKSKSGDIPMHILATRTGKIKYLPDVMAVYRKHEGGHSRTDGTDDEFFLRNRIFMYEMLNKETGFKFNERFKKNISRYYRMLLDSKQYQNRYFGRLPVAFKYLWLASPPKNIVVETIKTYIIPAWILNFSRIIKQKIGLIPAQ